MLYKLEGRRNDYLHASRPGFVNLTVRWKVEASSCGLEFGSPKMEEMEENRENCREQFDSRETDCQCHVKVADSRTEVSGW